MWRKTKVVIYLSVIYKIKTERSQIMTEFVNTLDDPTI